MLCLELPVPISNRKPIESDILRPVPAVVLTVEDAAFSRWEMISRESKSL